MYGPLTIMKPRTFRSLAIALLSLAPISVAAQSTQTLSAASQPSSEAGGGQKISATITGVQGLVQVRSAEDQPWKKAQVGMVLDEGSEFRTGPRSAVRFVIPPDQTITLDRLGTAKLLEIVRNGNKVRTDLGMKYGRTRYDIEAAGLEHESTVHSPNATLAIRGTKVTLTDQRPFPPEAVSLTGTAQYSTEKRQVALGGKGTGTATVSGDLTPADQALINSVIDPTTAFGRTPAENRLIATVISQGGVVTVDRTTGIPIVRGGLVPTNAQLPGILPGTLNFVLRWSGNTDLNLGVGIENHQGGQFLYPALGLNVIPNGQIPFDHRGGANGGFEIASLDPPIAKTLYSVGALYVSGQTTAVRIDAFLNGKQIPLFDGNEFVNEFKDTVGPTGTGSTFVIVPVGTTLPVPPMRNPRRR